MPFPFLAVIISTLISYGLTLVAAALSPRPKAARPDEVQVPTATEDRIKPYFVGTVRHTSPNCIWYGDFSTKKIKQSGIAAILSLGLAPSLGFKYFIGVQLDLGWGQMDALRRIEIAGKEAWTGDVSTGSFTIDKPELVSSGPVKDGFSATVVVYNGNGTQTADSYVASKVGSGIPSYKDDAYLVLKGLTSGGAYIGNSATFPEINMDVSRYPNTLSVTGDKHIIDTYDANPICALYEFLTRSDEEFGAGFVSSQFDLTNWRDAAETVYDEGIGVSRLITGDSDVVTVIQDYLKLVDGVINVNMQTGLIEIKLARNDYDPDTIPHFTDDDFTSIAYTRGAWEDTTNEVKLSYIDRTDNFADRIAAAQDVASAAGNVEVISTDLDIQGVSNPAIANDIVFRELRAISLPLGRLTSSMNRNGYGLSGGSVFKWTSETYGVEAMIFRVAEVSDGKLDDGTIQLKCIQDVFSLGDTAFSPAAGSGWTPIDSTAAVITTEAIFQQPTAFHNTADKRVFTVAKRPDTGHQAYDLWTKKSSEASYSLKASSQHFTPTGTVTSTFISGTDTTLTVTPDTDMEDLPAAVTPVDIANGDGLILIGSEILAYESYAISGGNYIFSGVHSHPGLYGTTPATHATSARVWFISEGMGLDQTNYPGGTTVQAKLLPTTLTETLDINSASVISVTVDSLTTTGIISGLPVDGTPSDGDIITYDAGSDSFVYGPPSGSGDMTKAVYDVNNNGKVDASEDSDALGGVAAALYATKSYVDGVLAGLSWKQMVRAATTGPGTLASSFENGDTIDGVVLATGNRILIKDQSSASENGIYIVQASGAPTRATDADSGAELVNASLYVSEGTVNADKQFVCTTNATITLGSTSITFAQFSSGGLVDGDYGDIIVGGSGTTMALDIAGAPTKTTPVDADSVGISDSAASGVFKRVTYTNVKAFLKTYFDTLYQAILVSGTNIKTLNGSSLLGSGNLSLASLSSVTSGLFAAPRTSNAEDDEFEGTSQDVKWTKTNSAAFESYDDHIRSAAYYRFNASSSDVGLQQNYANTGDFSVTLCGNVSQSPAPVSGSQNLTMQICDSTNQNIIEIQQLYNGGRYHIRSVKLVSGVFSQVQDINLASSSTTPVAPIMMHIQRATNNWNLYYSMDGVEWIQLGSAIALTMTVHHISLSFGPGAAAQKTHVALHWFRRDWLTL